jgi:hypothetical protein
MGFWSSYIDQVNADVDFNTLKADIDLAFRTGRAAIVVTTMYCDAKYY